VDDPAPNRPTAQRPAEILAHLRSGGVRALARAISTVEDAASGAAELLAACRAASGAALRIGVTGPPGAGKSTLVDRLVRGYRAQGKTVAVLAVDPSSPYSGGALLGDRIRMAGLSGDQGVYFRSMASRGATGGLSATASAVCAVMDAAGFEVILIETVGAGQAEVEVAALADATVVVVVPGMGDDVQSLKAGILEIASIFALNKADLDGADRLEAELLAMQGLAPSLAQTTAHAGPADPHWLPPIVRTVATTGQGVDELLRQIERFTREAAPNSRNTATTSAARSFLQHPQAGQPKLDHLGIAVRSIAAARTFYGSIGLTVSHHETVEHERVHTAMLPLGDTRIELLEPTAEDSTIARFLARRGEGLHHIALRPPGPDNAIDALFDRLRAEGVRLASDRVRTGAGGHRYFFIHPASTGGVLIEIVGGPAPQPPANEAAAQ